jgi:hypothetical protein
MFRARSALLLVSAIAIVSLGAGCDGGEERVSTAELVQRADEICGKERDSFERVQSRPPPSASVAADLTGELIQATEQANAQLRDLKPPEELQSSYDRYLEARDRVLDQMKRGREAAEDRDSTAYGAAQDAVARDAPKRRELAGALGLKVCSSTSGSA